MSALAPLLADMKTLIGALTVGTILVGVSALAADAQHLRQPKHDARAVTHDQRVHGDAQQTRRRHAISLGRQRAAVPRLHGDPWPPWINTRKIARDWLIARARASHVRATRTRPVQFPAPPGLRSGARYALASARGSARFRHFVTAITGGGWVLSEIKALSHGMKGQSNA